MFSNRAWKTCTMRSNSKSGTPPHVADVLGGGRGRQGVVNRGGGSEVSKLISVGAGSEK